jgi:uncharacterized protein YicC (UPF0701 family)
MTNGAAASPIPTWVNQIPWVPIITLVGWAAFAGSFYFTTKATLESHQQQIASIMTSREQLIREYTTTTKQMADGITQLNHLVALRSQEGTATTQALEAAIKRMDAREDKIVLLIDSLYQTQQEMLRQMDMLRRQ